MYTIIKESRVALYENKTLKAGIVDGLRTALIMAGIEDYGSVTVSKHEDPPTRPLAESYYRINGIEQCHYYLNHLRGKKKSA